jgi:hypothetical protein
MTTATSRSIVLAVYLMGLAILGLTAVLLSMMGMGWVLLVLMGDWVAMGLV